MHLTKYKQDREDNRNRYHYDRTICPCSGGQIIEQSTKDIYQVYMPVTVLLLCRKGGVIYFYFYFFIGNHLTES